MKPTASIVWLSSMLLTIACVSDCFAQNETNRPAAVLGGETSRPTPLLLSDPKPSRWTTEIIRLAPSSIDETVIIAFIENSGTFALAAEHIVQLDELGVSRKVISAMLRHDRELVAAQSQSTKVNNPAPAAASVEAAAANPNANEPGPVELAGATIQSPVSAAQSQRGGPSTVTAQKFGPSIAPVSPEARPAPPKKKKLYPVREPYPVELTAPIVFLDSPSF